MGRKPRASESPPLPPFEYMSRNRRAVFGDPPSAYLAAVIERNERARKKREQVRLENERNQDEEELPRKRLAPNNDNQANAYLTPAENGYLVWPGSGTPASSTYAVSGISHPQFADSESNGESRERSDNTSTDQTNDECEDIEGYGDEEAEQSQEDPEDDRSEGFQSSEDSEIDADMANDENISIQRQNPRSSQTTVTEKDEEDVDNGQDCKPGDRNDMVNKDLCAPSPIEVGGDRASTNLVSFTSNNALTTRNKHIRRHPAHPSSFSISNCASFHMFAVPGTIFVDPIDFDSDDIRSLAHSLATNYASQSFEGNEVIEIENIPLAEVIPQNSGSRLVGHRYSPISHSQIVFHASSSRTVPLPTVPASISEVTFTIDRSSNQDDPFREENDNGAEHYSDEFSYEHSYLSLDW
ncbi:hypothetical protein EMCG_00635 [[Emmonsia] crescens]|uniref:Uncharacterized protein n=1 Tax=[Emmonsia] crescens TaxID=73230 RepID=A0A0G2HSG1_9EURO|nr:hypothetical protein EMCG_00635 [Emmonsia crescens UAMH 3008]